MALAPRARAAPVGGGYRDEPNWVHVEIKLVITGTGDRKLRGSGTMLTADDMVVYFHHRPNVRRKGHIQPNGDIEWDNNIKWVRHEGAWPAPVASSSSLAKTTAWGVQRAMKKSHSCNF